MTAEEIAQIAADLANVPLRGGRGGNWMVPCGAHVDRRASLSIGTGRDGRVLLNCFAACPIDEVLKSLGLVPADLFSGTRSSPEERQAISAKREREREHGRRVGEAASEVRQLEDFVNRLGAELAKVPDSDPRGLEMTEQFHRTCEALHVAEVDYDQKRTTA